MKICLFGGPVFDGERLHEQGAVIFDETGILEVRSSGTIPTEKVHSIDVRGALILPGLVDLHSDVLEKCIEMRPGVDFDPGFAMEALDRRLAACGISTFCHAVSFADNELGLRSPHKAAETVRRIKAFSASGEASVRHLVHARFEVGSEKARAIFEELLECGYVDVASIMDHTPGQGQFRTYEAYHRYYAGTYKLTSSQTAAMAASKIHRRDRAWHDVLQLTETIRRCGVPLLSHDDDNREKVSLVHSLGAVGCEFPISLDAAEEARRRNMAVLMGAPNVVRGSSSNNNLSARKAVSQGLTDILVSDYYPECLIQAPFILAHLGCIPLESALTHVTSNPARLLKHFDVFGALKPGFSADLAVVNIASPWVRPSQLWVGGRLVYESRPSSHGCLWRQDTSQKNVIIQDKESSSWRMQPLF
ncbi:MAG: alpha-D-ribose 1-methylphosphonate 5-triphosphate diphosphatase [Desulfosoma sp.]